MQVSRGLQHDVQRCDRDDKLLSFLQAPFLTVLVVDMQYAWVLESGDVLKWVWEE